jgi:hypothetical protein
MTNSPLKTILILIVLSGIALGGYIVYTQTQTASDKNIDKTKLVAKVGKENIYRSDLEYEKSYFPPVQMTESELNKFLINKIATDSVTLQAAEGQKLITLTQDIYNAPTKDYPKRIKTIQEIKQKIEAKTNRIQGTVITLFFVNNGYIGPLGYDKSKQFAYKKIESIYNKVKTKEITIDQAEKTLQSDTSLKEIDKRYEHNVAIHFDVTEGDRITFDPDFDQKITELKQGELTYIMALKEGYNSKGNPLRDILYAFAQVTSRKSDGQKEDFDKWIEKNRSKYEITIY